MDPAILVAAVTLLINAAFLIEGLYPYQWFSPGLALLILFIVYPTIFTIYVAFTNYRDGNLLTKPQARDVLEDQLYLPTDAPTYSWTAFRSTEDPNEYALWLIPIQGADQPVLAKRGETIPADEVDLGDNTLDEDGIPTGLAGFEQVRAGSCSPSSTRCCRRRSSAIRCSDQAQSHASPARSGCLPPQIRVS